ncbi:MAG: putative sensor protein, partial [Frankiales bacterium]|nr:putative sensor protein [Frankiales bacterium]
MPAQDRPGSGPPERALSDPRRLAAVRRLMDAGPRGDHLDRLTRLAAHLLDAPYAQVSLLSEEQYVWSVHGLEAAAADTATPAADSLCTITVQQAAPLAVEDARTDERVRRLPPVVSGTVRAYLGVPVVGSRGDVLGALCVYDDRPHVWSPQAVGILGELAISVSAELELQALSLDAIADAARLELALDAAEIGSFDLDGDTYRLRWDDRLVVLFGYDRATFVEHLDSFTARVHPDDVQRVTDEISATLETSGNLAVSYRIVLPGRGVRWIEARGRVLQGRRGRAKRLLGVAYDATELRDARDRLARVLETMTDALIVHDRDWRMTYVNHEAERTLGRRQDELLGEVVWEALPTTPEVRARLEHALLTGEATGFVEHYPQLGDGAWLEVRAVPGPEGLSVYFHDVTARQRSEEESRRADVERQQAVVERERAYAAAEAANTRLALLADASRELGASLQPQEVLETLSRIVVPTLGQWLAVALAADTTAVLLDRETEAGAVTVVHVAHAHDDTALRRLMTAAPLSTYDLVGVGAVVRTGQSEWLPTIPDRLLEGLTSEPDLLEQFRAVATGSALTLPLANRGRVLGAVTVAEPAGGPVDRQLLADICQRAAVALDNALLYGAEQ